jgi:hypothetical protein
MSMKSELEGLAQNLNEIMESTAAVKGIPFANAVALHFEAMQLAEIIGNLSGLLKGGQKIDPEIIDSMTESAVNVLFSVVYKGMGELSDDQIKEASDLGESLHKRRVRSMEAIRKDMGAQ